MCSFCPLLSSLMTNFECQVPGEQTLHYMRTRDASCTPIRLQAVTEAPWPCPRTFCKEGKAFQSGLSWFTEGIYSSQAPGSGLPLLPAVVVALTGSIELGLFLSQSEPQFTRLSHCLEKGYGEGKAQAGSASPPSRIGDTSEMKTWRGGSVEEGRGSWSSF